VVPTSEPLDDAAQTARLTALFRARPRDVLLRLHQVFEDITDRKLFLSNNYVVLRRISDCLYVPDPDVEALTTVALKVQFIRVDYSCSEYAPTSQNTSRWVYPFRLTPFGLRGLVDLADFLDAHR
jgi:hypothetical protein